MSDGAGLPEHVRMNREFWNGLADEYAVDGLKRWEEDEPHWGIFALPESEVGVFPSDLEGLDAVELGCGTAYVSAWLARRGARPVGIDNSEEQLATARKLQERFGLEFPLHHGNAERTPFEDESFDLAISEYGASIWCDPYEWIPEAARLLRPGGRLIFMINGILRILCDPDEGEDVQVGERLERPLFGLHRSEWVGEEGVDFHLPHGELIRLLRQSGFELEELHEVQAPEGATSRYQVPLEWARQWPCEEVWKARKAGS